MQLIDADTDKHLWAETYDRDLSVTSIFDIQSDIAHAVSRALQANLTSDEEDRLASLPTGSLAAYDAFSRGKLLLPRRTTAALSAAEKAFREALALDPEYAEAYVGLADSLVLQVDYSGLKVSEYLADAAPIIEKAIELDPLLGEAYIARAMWLDWRGDFRKSRENFAKGVSLSPGYAPGHQWYGNRLAQGGRLEQGIDELRIAHELDPQSGIIITNLAEQLHVAGQAAEGWRMCNELVEQRPAYSRGYQCLWILAWSEGKVADAIRYNQRSMELDPGNPGFYSLHGFLLSELGLDKESEAWFEAQLAGTRQTADIHAGLGSIYFNQGQGRRKDALDLARKALQIDPGSYIGLSLLAVLDLNDERDLGALEMLSSTFPGLTRSTVEVDYLSAEQSLLLAALMAKAGQAEQAEKIATAAEKTFRRMYGIGLPLNHAQALVLLGREAEAATALRRAIDTGTLGSARWSGLASPIFERLRQQPQFQDIFDAIDASLEQQRELYLASRNRR